MDEIRVHGRRRGPDPEGVGFHKCWFPVALAKAVEPGMVLGIDFLEDLHLSHCGSVGSRLGIQWRQAIV
jgi:hypothetical protein